ncbi:MAG: hypothetical protein HY606_03640 [Planctomycetes bacterium]|nr:hypothetical protein [Planctomycetota bacterium]
MSDKDKLRTAMKEVITLPSDDPLRLEVESQISQAGEWAEKEWLDLLIIDEKMKLALQKVEVPADIREKLLLIPEESPRRFTLHLRPGFLAGMSAIVLLIVAIIFFYNKHVKSNQVQSLIVLAINDHINNRNIEIFSGDIDGLKSELKNQVDFDVILPKFQPDLSVVGGRLCKMVTYPLVYTLWKDRSREYSLFQFKLSDLGIDPFNEPRFITPSDGGALHKSPCEVLWWTDESYGFILVAERGEFLRDIKPLMTSRKG